MTKECDVEDLKKMIILTMVINRKDKRAPGVFISSGLDEAFEVLELLYLSDLGMRSSLCLV